MNYLTCVLHHHIGPESKFEAGLNIATDFSAYEAQIDWLSHQFNFVSLEQLLSGDLPKKPLLLTFDDAFHSVLDVAKTILAEKDIPSVFFINPGLLEDGAISLDSTLAWATHMVGLNEVCKFLSLPTRSNLGEIIAGDMSVRGAEERQEVINKLLSTFGPPDLSSRAKLIDAEDLRHLQSLGVEVGNHTMTHVHCRSLSAEEQETEIIKSKERLEELTGQRVRSLSIPYGHEHDLTESVLDVARTSGHEAIFLVHSRANWLRPASDIWYRTSLHHETPKQLKMELTTKPFFRTVKNMVLG